MDFEGILRNEDRSDMRTVIGLSIYYLEEIKGQSSVSSSDISDLIDNSRMQKPSPSSIAAYIRHMKDDGIVKKRGRGYILTLSGIEKYKDKVGTADMRRDGVKFIGGIHISDEFYSDLIADINNCYQAGVDEATLILTRKLIENLLIDLLRTKYGHSEGDIDLFYDTENRQFRRFSTLIENIQTNMGDFEYYSDRMDDEIISEIRELKNGGDASAHSIELAPSEEIMEEYQSKANDLADILSYTLNNIRESSN